ncbi:methylated DNA-protein cysteine methyltransferase [Brachyspira pilosicoli WesB]|uniref:methylated-DNA--[protein]-cysteine S-methyltransferase n=4 Tax=Brachyspira pilosicoli TaxID=52584 RepID=D8IB00_BRAP9|nr:methylated-DNA--[protein]-cysteine S-methyltransferase [Brachyspira pilosicoli]ADK30323.1 methylated DNA-protein cysteine methyltransferase [Brachyspira pilosicoli 95/1000]AGA65632.1 methylated DNA-protein cysteine methyltransferase [Brachyspira pilosicoli P43/6/78]WIH83852.1 methylated-DNA--[protein]-cysteine S-methyltransferase [Brachyspira pilosicoli]WIH88837.1 methylated-DNA--[protein]-cysteine S-methyltransferase [Brachyspira pilosicoli]WIH91106.1 methylated-DNA--[protein]-cysteine S-m
MNIIRLENSQIDDKVFLYKSPIGNLYLTHYKDYITSISFQSNYSISTDKEPEIIKEAKKELDEYFNLKRKIFDIPIAVYGSDFQYKVWIETYKIPFGEIETYSNIAKKISNSFGSIFRAVGSAEGKNKIPIIIPCHRVVSKDLKLTGYAGGIEKKEYLLKLEGFNIDKLKIIR